MLNFAAALLLLASGMAIWYAWRRDRDLKRLAIGVGWVVVGYVLIALGRSMLVYRPLLILHIAALLLYGWAVGLYLWRGRLHWALAAPFLTAALFFVAARFFGEGV